MDHFIKVTGIKGKVGGYFCRLPLLNENTARVSKVQSGGSLNEDLVSMDYNRRVVSSNSENDRDIFSAS